MVATGELVIRLIGGGCWLVSVVAVGGGLLPGAWLCGGRRQQWLDVGWQLKSFDLDLELEPTHKQTRG